MAVSPAIPYLSAGPTHPSILAVGMLIGQHAFVRHVDKLPDLESGSARVTRSGVMEAGADLTAILPGIFRMNKNERGMAVDDGSYVASRILL
jgi:hypothetical protein